MNKIKRILTLMLAVLFCESHDEDKFNTPISSGAKRPYKKRLGNGHRSEKRRDLKDHEKRLIRNHLFLPKMGHLKLDDCVNFKRKFNWNDVSIFQITGYVTVLHRTMKVSLI
jgi:hypothetical protein